MKTMHRAVITAKSGYLLGGTKRHESSWFPTKKNARDWAWAVRLGNKQAGRQMNRTVYETRKVNK